MYKRSIGKNKELYVAAYISPKDSYSCNLLSKYRSVVNYNERQKSVETLLGNDAFRYLSTCSNLFTSSVNSLAQDAPKSILCQVSQHFCRPL